MRATFSSKMIHIKSLIVPETCQDWSWCHQICSTVIANLPLRVPEECPQELVDLYKACLRPKAEDRPSAVQVMKALEAAISTSKEVK